MACLCYVIQSTLLICHIHFLSQSLTKCLQQQIPVLPFHKLHFSLKWAYLLGRMYRRKVDVDMLNAIKSVLADVSSVSPLSEERAFKESTTCSKRKKFNLCSYEGPMLKTSANTHFTVFSISTSTLRWYILRFTTAQMQTKTSSHRD